MMVPPPPFRGKRRRTWFHRVCSCATSLSIFTTPPTALPSHHDPAAPVELDQSRARGPPPPEPFLLLQRREGEKDSTTPADLSGPSFGVEDHDKVWVWTKGGGLVGLVTNASNHTHHMSSWYG